MTQVTCLRSGGKQLFGSDDLQDGQGPNQSHGRAQDYGASAALTAELNARLREKYRNYERAAARLELRGEHDAAELLRRAAGRARLLRNVPKPAEG